MGRKVGGFRGGTGRCGRFGGTQFVDLEEVGLREGIWGGSLDIVGGRE